MKEFKNITAEKTEMVKLDYLFNSYLASANANILVCFFLALFLYNKVNNKFLMIWVSAILIVVLCRMFIYKIYTTISTHKYRFFFRLFYIPMMLNGFIWALSSFLIYNKEHYINSIILIVLIGISMGAVTTLASSSFFVNSYQSILLLPVVIKLFYNSSPYSITLAILIFVYYIFILLMSNRIFRTVHENIIFKEVHKSDIEELKISENKFKTIFNHAPIGIFYVTRDNIIYDCNNEFCATLEASKDQLINFNINKVRDKRVLRAINESNSGISSIYEGPYETTISRNKIWVSLNCSPIFNDEKEVVGTVGIIQNRTETQLAEERVRHLAYHDGLTALPNRLLLIDRLKLGLSHSKRSLKYGAVLFLDLDNFKSINDSLGHHIGDLILKECGDRLISILRTEDTVARIGGDEFVIILPDLQETIDASMVSVNLVTDKIHSKISEPYYHMEKTLFTSTSIGVVLFSGTDISVEELLKNADTAMYEAKKRGRGCTHYFSEEINRRVTKMVELENNLRLALQKGEFAIHFQPIYNGETKELLGAETLIRWYHPEMGIISPVEFIPLAEETNLIVPIGDWVIKEACKTLKYWDDNNIQSLEYISINVSVNQLKIPDFIKKLVQYTKEYNVNPSTILLEVTESQLISNFNFISSKIAKLRELGFRFALDDFGTGYSSLTYLKKLEMDVIKIDRSFIKDIFNNDSDVVLVEAILSIAKNFNMKVIAEGVEEIKQINILNSLGCKYYQGFFYSKPLHVNDFKILLKSRKSVN